MRRSVFSDAGQSALYTDFWHSVMEGALEGREQVTQALRQFPYPMRTHMACIVVTSDTHGLDPLQLQEVRTALLDVLEAYLTNAQNLTLTARALYMHRNTVSNKLNKIEEVLGHKPFDEPNHFLILLSCMIVR